MARIILTVVCVLVALLGAIYQLHVKPFLAIIGVGRVVENIGTRDCKVVPELKACEKITLHQPTGVLYLACSTPESRVHWTPCLLHLNASGRSTEDYIATYDPKNSRITRLKQTGLPQGGLSVHGMDVVPSTTNPKELFVYLVNHQPFVGQDATKSGANSTIEIFRTKVGGSAMTHLHTVHSPSVIISPNDIVGLPDGKSFYFTNDAGAKTGLKKQLALVLRKADTSVGYCNVDEGCKMASAVLHHANGIASVNETVYVANALSGTVTALERQSDNSLVVTDVIPIGQPLDNLSIDSDGMLWTASMPNTIAALKAFRDPALYSPSAALRISQNTGQQVFFGHKFKFETVFQDTGPLTSWSTSAVHDAQRGRLFMHGIISPHLTVCKV